MNNVALIANFNISDKAEVAFAVSDRIAARAQRILIPIAYKDRILRMHRNRREFVYCSPEELYRDAELVVVLGGDGFMLEAARRAAPLGTPILGINLGRVGYMTEIEPTELELIDQVLDGHYTVDSRAMLSVDVYSKSGQHKANCFALNDAVIANGSTARIVDLMLSDNGEEIFTLRADGIVIATPTGSTAYSLSAGGPIIDPKLSCFCVTPICPHSLLARPLIFPDTARLEVKNICTREKVLHLTVDGRASYDLFYGDSVVVTRSELSVNLVRIKNEGFYSKIRNKKFQ